MTLPTLHRASATLLVLSLLISSPAAVGFAQEPLPGKPSDPPALRIPPQSLNNDEDRGDDAEEGPEVVEGGAVDKIREMLQGEGDSRETGDPILDGVLDLLRNRGSVLDGSALDPRSQHREPEPLPGGRGWVPYVEGNGEPVLERETANDANRFLLAEQLLKTARLLAAEPHVDAQRRRLIDDLRQEAARSLMLAPIPSPEPRTPPNLSPIPAGHSESF